MLPERDVSHQSDVGGYRRRIFYLCSVRPIFSCFCFPLRFNSSKGSPFVFDLQVQAALKRQWMQYKTQWGQRRKDHCSMRSTSYTATSITEVPAFMYHHECNSEHLNGRHTEDSELVALKMGETYA